MAIIYNFELDLSGTKVFKIVLEAKESTGSYEVYNSLVRLNKSDVGRVIYGRQLFLLEDDAEKALEIFKKKFEADINIEQGEILMRKKNIAKIKEKIQKIEYKGEVK